MNLQSLKLFLKETFLASLVFSITVFAWLRLIFFEVPFSVYEDGMNITKTILFGWAMMMMLKAAWLLLLHAAQKIEAVAAGKIKWNTRLLKRA
jgi:hypothetical protein